MTTSTLPPTLIASPEPALDGITHINLHYNHGTTKLGRMLAPFYVARFEHPYFGPFKCIEGLMLYLRTGCRDDTFRSLTGSQAKNYYHKQLHENRLISYDLENEEALLLDAYYYRILQHSVTKCLLVESTLPFDNYYLYGIGKLPIRPDGTQQLVNVITQLREIFQDKIPYTSPPTATYAALRRS